MTSSELVRGSTRILVSPPAVWIVPVGALGRLRRALLLDLALGGLEQLFEDVGEVLGGRELERDHLEHRARRGRLAGGLLVDELEDARERGDGAGEAGQDDAVRVADRDHALAAAGVGGQRAQRVAELRTSVFGRCRTVMICVATWSA